MGDSGPPRRHASAMAVAAILYAITLAGSYLFLRRSLEAAPGMPALYGGVAGAVLAILPAASFIALAVTVYRVGRDVLARTWGARLKARLAVLFLATAFAAIVPPAAAYGSVAARAVGMASSAAVRAAVAGGTEIALAYYESKDAALRYAAERDLGELVARYGPDADTILSILADREPALCSLELFSGERSVDFAGDPAVRSPDGIYPHAADGFLPRLSTGLSSYARYAVRGAPGRGRLPLDAVLSLRLPRVVETASTSLAGAAKALEESGRVAGSLSLYLALFGLSLVFPLATLAIVFSQAAADAVFRPMAALWEGVRGIGVRGIGAGERRIPNLSKPGDEAGQLVGELNAMLERLERLRGDELRNERVGAWRDIARRLAHELRNPLTPIRLSAERVLKRWKADPASVADILEKSMVAIVQETAGMEILLSEFKDFARLPEPQKDWIRLRDVVDESVHLYSASWPRLAIDASGVDGELRIRADRGQVKQVLSNLITNAADATGGEGTVTIRGDLVKTAESRYCRLQVSDDGRGIPADLRDRVFSPYFSTKPEGTGLGLAIVEHIVASHGGSVRFDSAEGVGTTFYLDLPAD